MSDHWVKLIPADPQFVPSDAAVERGRAEFASFIGDAQEVTVFESDTVTLIHAGANMERVSCAACGESLSWSWWGSAMDSAFDRERGFEELEVAMPCCDQRLSLNDLEYHFPIGFARFALEAMNPSDDRLTSGQIAELESVLGTSLRIIWEHL